MQSAKRKKLGIPTVCLADTDCDPDTIDICVPGNDDAIRAINLFLPRRLMLFWLVKNSKVAVTKI